MSVFSKISGRIAFVLGLMALILILSLAPGFKAGWWDFGFAYSKFKYVVYLGFGAAALAIVHLITSLLAKQKIAGLAIIGLLFGLGAASVPLKMKSTAESLPYIHDITTDTVNPPEFIEIAALRANSPNPVSYNSEESSLQITSYPDIKTLAISKSSDMVFANSLKTVNDLGWELVSSDSTTGRIEATETTTWFGFKDDVVIRISGTGDSSILDIRSKSRMGRSDLGANAARIRKFRDKLLSQ